jgi:hypothetical protein
MEEITTIVWKHYSKQLPELLGMLLPLTLGI